MQNRDIATTAIAADCSQLQRSTQDLAEEQLGKPSFLWEMRDFGRLGTAGVQKPSDCPRPRNNAPAAACTRLRPILAASGAVPPASYIDRFKCLNSAAVR